MTNYSLQGTNWAYRSTRGPGEPNWIWLRSRNARSDAWEDLAGLEVPE